MKRFMTCVPIAFAAWMIGGANLLMADGPADNKVDSVRPVPPPGVAIPEEQRAELNQGLEELSAKIRELRKSRSPVVLKYLPDVEVFEKGLRVALTEDGFFDVREVDSAKKVLTEGLHRATMLSLESVDWLLPTKLERDYATVRGFRSKLDGSIQPYGVIYRSGPIDDGLSRGDVWCRGRSEKGLEMQFIAQRLAGGDPKPVPGVWTIHPFGRYCNANKLAGEVDTLEALEHALREYPIDPNGVSIRGFSMGGAAAWHLAVHYPDKWFAANPGAGFSETPKFLNVFQSETLEPAWYEKKLWTLYDCPYWVNNLKNLPTIAYSGEIDKQKQAADVMAEASWNQSESDRFELTHIIGPRTAHKIETNAGNEIERRLDVLYRSRRNQTPKGIDLTTYTLKYNQCHWVTIDKLEEHWMKGRVRASLGSEETYSKITLLCEGVSQFSIHLDADELPASISTVDVHVFQGQKGQNRLSLRRQSDRSWFGCFVKSEERPDSAFRILEPLEKVDSGLVKKHDLQGPIDDAFMSSFLFVKPSVDGQHPEVDRWVQSEMEHAIREWHRQMRGDVRVVSVDDLKDTDIEQNNIILWGDPKSNSKLASILPKLPVQWDREKVKIGKESFDAATHVPVLVYPNPLNPTRYVVLNSSFTYREYDYLNNARQVPKLPDWAVVDIRKAPDARWPGKVVSAGFFGEKWELKEAQ